MLNPTKLVVGTTNTSPSYFMLERLSPGNLWETYWWAMLVANQT